MHSHNDTIPLLDVDSLLSTQLQLYTVQLYAFETHIAALINAFRSLSMDKMPLWAKGSAA